MHTRTGTTRTYHVYILASRSRNLYVGVTGNIVSRLAQHRAGTCEYTRRYRIDRLVHLESTTDVRAALAREKQIKAYGRTKKVALITAANAAWDDLFGGAPTAR